MTISLGVVMDALSTIHVKKDSTIAMLEEAQRRGWTNYFFEQKDIFLQNGEAYGRARQITLFLDKDSWFTLSEPHDIPLADLSVILMRKDPPFDLDYIYTTYLLEQAERKGTLIINKPQSLRDANEKLFTAWFEACCPPTLVTQNKEIFKAFFQQHEDIVCKPLDSMGGRGVFRLQKGDMNASVVFEMLTQHGTHYMMAQKFIPEIKQGDKRILLINGEPVPFALARIPAEGELRGNLVAGATGVAQPLTTRDRWICQQVGPVLREKGLWFVGLDVIGDFLTEINVTSPTCIREIEAQCTINISALLLTTIEQQLASTNIT